LEIWALGVYRFLGYTHNVMRLGGEQKPMVDSFEQRERVAFMRHAFLIDQATTVNAKVGEKARPAMARISKC
jgi:hypothetical protein